MPPRPTCPGVTPPTSMGWTSHINNENEKMPLTDWPCSQGHFLNSGSLFSMTSFYQVDKNLTRTLYTLQAVPLLKWYACPHSPWGISLLGESQAQWEPGGKYALPRERTGIFWGWGGIYNIVTAPVSQLPWSQSSIVPICLPRRIFWVFGATYFPIAQSFDPNFFTN